MKTSCFLVGGFCITFDLSSKLKLIHNFVDFESLLWRISRKTLLAFHRSFSATLVFTLKLFDMKAKS